jgi:hypothetical protein
MPMLFNQTRVDETATFFAAELKDLLDRRNSDSHMNRRFKEACPSWDDELTNGEQVLATIKALNLVSVDLIADLATMTRDPTFGERLEDVEG